MENSFLRSSPIVAASSLYLHPRTCRTLANSCPHSARTQLMAEFRARHKALIHVLPNRFGNHRHDIWPPQTYGCQGGEILKKGYRKVQDLGKSAPILEIRAIKYFDVKDKKITWRTVSAHLSGRFDEKKQSDNSIGNAISLFGLRHFGIAGTCRFADHQFRLDQNLCGDPLVIQPI